VIEKEGLQPVRRRRQGPVWALSRSKLKMRTLMGGFRFRDSGE